MKGQELAKSRRCCKFVWLAECFQQLSFRSAASEPIVAPTVSSDPIVANCSTTVCCPLILSRNSVQLASTLRSPEYLQWCLSARILRMVSLSRGLTKADRKLKPLSGGEHETRTSCVIDSKEWGENREGSTRNVSGQAATARQSIYSAAIKR